MNPTAALTPELAQRLEALDRANEIRSARSQLKRDLKAGEANLAAILNNPPDRLHSMRVRDLLRAVPKLGQVRVDHLLKTTQIAPGKTLAAMTHRQVRDLMLALDRQGRL